MNRRAAITRTDLVALIAILGFLAAAAAVMLYPVATRLFPGLPRPESRRVRCRDNLRQLANGLGGYAETLGDRRWYPWPLGRGTRPDDYNGAEWLASLYWTAVIPDPQVMIRSSGPAWTWRFRMSWASW